MPKERRAPKSVVIEFEDKPRVFTMNVAAQARFRALTGKTIDEMSEDVEEFAKLAWCCLVSSDPELTLEQLEEMLNYDEMMDIAEAIEVLYPEAPNTAPLVDAPSRGPLPESTTECPVETLNP